MGGAQALLARPWWLLRFPAPWEQRFQRETGRARARRLTVATAVGGFSFLALILGDRVSWSLADPLTLLRCSALGLAAAVAGLGVIGWRRRPPVGLLELGITASSLTITAYSIAAHRDARPFSLIEIGALVLVFSFTGIVARQQFRFTVLTSLGTWVGYAAFGYQTGPLASLTHRSYLLLFGTALVFSLATNYVLERSERRALLLRWRDAEQRVVLTSLAEQLRRSSREDALTGLANRRHYDVEFDRFWRAAADLGAGVALVAVDVDFFKRYNDRYGHPAGDVCLQRVAGVLAELAAAHGGVAGRLGGEEFGLLLPGVDQQEADRVAAQTCAGVRALQLPHANSDTKAYVTVSVGTAWWEPALGGGPQLLHRAADDALYQAKKAGRNRWAAGTVRVDGGPPSRSSTEGPGPELPGRSAIDRLAGLLTGGSGYRLTLPADLERGYASSSGSARRWRMLLLGAVGMLVVWGYVWYSRPMFPDVADQMMLRLSVVVGVLAVLLGAVTVPGVPQVWRDWAYAIAPVTAVGTVAEVLATSHAPTAPSYALSLALIPAYCAVAFGLPCRMFLVSAVLTLVPVFGLLRSDAAAATVWRYAVELLVLSVAYALIASYLLELGNRREFLLVQLEAAERAALQASTDQLQRLASTDPLTGLVNRRQYELEQARLLDRCAADHAALALLILDVDHFKGYNDGYGHPAGDACLRLVADELRRWTEQEGRRSAEAPVAARLGGEEFGVLLPGCDVDDALVCAELVRGGLRRLHIEHRWSPVADEVTVSIGVASVRPARAGAERRLLVDADAALYRAKAGGRDRVSS